MMNWPMVVLAILLASINQTLELLYADLNQTSLEMPFIHHTILTTEVAVRREFEAFEDRSIRGRIP